MEYRVDEIIALLPGNSLRIWMSRAAKCCLAIDVGETRHSEIAVSPHGTHVSAICQLPVNQPSAGGRT